MDKRSFLHHAAALAALPFLPPVAWGSSPDAPGIPDDLEGEAFWAAVREDYMLHPDYINLESGYYCMLPSSLLRRYHHHINEVNFEHSRFMRTRRDDEQRRAVEVLAGFAGCDPGELVITRNTTESLDTILSGIDWKPGDEVIYAAQEYGSMIEMLRQISARWGVVLRELSVPLDPSDDEEILSLYRNLISDRTRLILASHMINITGQILPIRAICDMAHRRGVQVLVDGAHAIGHFQFNIRDLNCDYYGSSLHKWLSAPLGSGLLYVRKEHIPSIWPMLGDETYPKHDIRKLNHVGTIPMAVNMTIPDSIAYLNQIGAERKQQRLSELKTYWMSHLRTSGVERFIFNTPSDPRRSCAIGNIGIEGIDPQQLTRRLFDEFGIWQVAINYAGVYGVRITPNIYTTFEELDRLIDALLQIARS